MTMRPICVKCAKEMHLAKNEFLVKDELTAAFPATVWFGDLYECLNCGATIVTGFGQKIEGEAAAAFEAEAMEFKR